MNLELDGVEMLLGFASPFRAASLGSGKGWHESQNTDDVGVPGSRARDRLVEFPTDTGTMKSEHSA